MKRDREVVIAAINNNGLMLKFVSEDLCRYREIVTAAVKQNPGELQSASEDIHRERIFL